MDNGKKNSEQVSEEGKCDEQQLLEKLKKSLSGYLGHVSNKMKVVNNCLEEELTDSKELESATKALRLAWMKYEESCNNYISKEITVDELNRVKEKLVETKMCVSDLIMKAEATLNVSKKGKSIKTRASAQSKAKKLRKDIELKRLLLKQEEEMAQYQLDMERKKIEIEFEAKRRACEMKFQIQLAEKEVQFLEKGEGETESQVTESDKDSLGLMPPMTQEEKICKWVTQSDTKPLNPCLPEFKPLQDPPCPENSHPESNPSVEQSRMKHNETPAQSSLPDNHMSVMLKLTMLQAMHPIKFSGNPSDYPNFRNRLRDNLEDDILSDSQKVEFLPKFLSGEALEVVERVTGCTYPVIIKILEDRYGQPATVAAACIENLTQGPRLGNNDYKGLRNFAEQLESASKKLVGEYELEASTTSNLKQIIRRLPAYLVNKWGDFSYKIREKGGNPKLCDLAVFVKRQAAIKNDPGFVKLNLNEQKGGNEKRPEQPGKGRYQSGKQTSAFKTDVGPTPPRKAQGMGNSCPCCSGSHRLSECTSFMGKDLPGRWKIVKENKLCHVCLRGGHMRDKCHSMNYCNCKSERKHHKLLHNPPRARGETSTSDLTNADPRPGTTGGHTPLYHAVGQGGEDSPREEQRVTEHYATLSERPHKTVLLHVVPVKIITLNGNCLTTYGLLDNASRGTVISSDIAKKLELKGQKEMISFSTLMEKSEEEIEIVEFQLQSANGVGDIVCVKEGIVSQKFNINEKFLPKNIDRLSHPHLRDINIPEVQIPKVSVLIGKDVDYAHEVFEVRKSSSTDSHLKALRGPLGWVITGTIHNSTHKEINVNFTCCDRKLQDQIEKFWKLEGYGTKAVNRATSHPGFILHHLSQEDLRALEKLKKSTKKRDGHYETGLLWRDENVKLPNNREEAERRLQSLKRKFGREPGLEDKYRAAMEQYITKGHAHKLTPDEMTKFGHRTWYLPHFFVTNINKPGKLRIVFDAASKYKGASLNANLLQGPDCTNNLAGVLLRFREDNVALVADIEGMFLQVGVADEDQDSLRFLWWDKSSEDPPDEYVMKVHVFGATDSPCAANWVLKKTATDNACDFDPVTVETVLHSFYVDDVLKSVGSPADAIRLANQLTELCKRGGFNLTKYMTNSREVLAEIPVEKRAVPTLDLDLDELPVERALGVRWNVESDNFGFKINKTQKADTMRGVLSTISSVFDPLNFAAPVIMRGKQIMQALWRRKTPWDEPLSGEILEKWHNWKRDLLRLEDMTIPRCYFSRPDHGSAILQLHHFCDASEVGYGTVTYLRIEYPDGETECSFVTAKSRNAPIKSVSIPRLELQGALLAARVDDAVRRELDLNPEKVVFWTDSMITLNYIKNDSRRFQTYVANRVTEIRELTSAQKWRHCPGKLNPADEVSRGLGMDEFLQNKRWINGPNFLKDTEDKWPENKFNVLPDDSLELKKEVFCTDPENVGPLEKLLNNTSDWMKTVRKVAWLLKYLDWIKARKDMSDEEMPGDRKKITTDDLERAKRRIAVLVQKRSFPGEMESLEKGNEVKSSSSILRLKPISKDDGVMRVGGRISMAPISTEARNPIILPKNDHITTILIRHVHESNGHCGVEQVLAILREQFWVVKARVAIKLVLRRCIHCRKQHGSKSTQEMGDLPKVRMIPYEQPFTYTGLDYFGPYYIKRGRGRVLEKRWGAIFVCMNSRAVHLELAKSLETDDFILALMRFLNRRGHVKELWSDNGSNFVGADREIREYLEKMDQEKLERRCMERGCKWTFHPPGASHMSGVWERMVRVVKRSLKAIVGKEPLNDDVLNTLFTEAERIANSRPLTRNPENPEDDDPLTPNHFLNVRPTSNLPTETDERADKFSRKRWRQAQLLANHYWRRWLREYIPALQIRSKWNQKQRNLRIGDIVLVADDNVPRNVWPLARIVNVFPGQDGLVRSVEVRAKGTTYKRPITKICLLEAEDDEV